MSKGIVLGQQFQMLDLEATDIEYSNSSTNGFTNPEDYTYEYVVISWGL